MGQRLPKTAPQISAELSPEFRTRRPLGKAPFWVLGLCSPILGIWYISLCIISLKATLWKTKGIWSLEIPALPYGRGFVYDALFSLSTLTIILGSIKQDNKESVYISKIKPFPVLCSIFLHCHKSCSVVEPLCLQRHWSTHQGCLLD